jgi:serine/threonine-protein kinase
VDATYVEGDLSAASAETYRARHAGLKDAGRWVRFVRAGGMGAVVEVAGEDQGDGSGLAEGEQRFALKMVKDSLRGRSAVVERFRRELMSHRKLTVDLMATRLVPCVAVLEGDERVAEDVLDDVRDLSVGSVGAAGAVDKELFGLFPFFPEGSLESCLDRGISKREALFIVVDAVEGLQSLHGHRYVHRDFHPSNILVEREGGRPRGMLGDLGVGMFWEANTIFSPERVEEDREHRVGHPGYIDPYVRASPHADLYAVGVTLFRILAGSVPPMAAAEPLCLPASSEGSPPWRKLVDEVLAKMTAPQVAARFASAREARSAVVRLAEELPEATSSADGASADSPLVPQFGQRPRPAVSRVGKSLPVTAVGGRRRWRRLAAVPLAALVFAVVGFGGWQLVEPGAVKAPPQGETIEAAETSGPDSVTKEAHGTSGKPVPSRDSPKPPPSRTESSSRVASPPPPSSTPTRSPPSSIPPPSSSTPSSSLSLGALQTPLLSAADLAEVDSALQVGRFDRAQLLLEDLRASHPTDPEMASRLASLFLRDRETGPGRARRILTTSVKAHPQRGDLRHFLARVLLQVGQDSEALMLLREAPPNSSFAREIRDFQVTLERAADPQ